MILGASDDAPCHGHNAFQMPVVAPTARRFLHDSFYGFGLFWFFKMV